MNKRLLSIIAVTALLVGLELASAETTSTTTTTWTNDQGTTIREYSTTKKYQSFNDTALRTNVGTELPSTVTLYPLPETLKVPDADQYSYTIINNQPVVVETTTRKVVHSWEQ